MWMKHQVLSPTVQHGEEADLGAEMFGVGGNGAQGFRSGPKENVVHHFLVLVSDGGNLFRESKDDMEILGVEELGLTILDPLGPCQGLAFWAMAVAAGVVGNALVRALITLFQVAAEGGGPAQFDGTHDAALGRGERSTMLFTISFAITTQHVGDFQPGTFHGPALRSTEESPACFREEPDAGADQAGWWWSTPWWWQYADSGRWWPGCDGRAGVEWCEYLYCSRRCT